MVAITYRFLLLIITVTLSVNAVYQSRIIISPKGMEFQPQNSIQLLSITTTPTLITCSASCNQLSSCRTFDYDLVSKRCRLFEGDSITGSVISSSSSSTTSLVGFVRISSSLYSSSRQQLCQICTDNRYEVCVTSTNTCECPSHTYWNGSVCALQLFVSDTCEVEDSCRSDLNLTCQGNCYGEYAQCVLSSMSNANNTSSMRYGVTVAGGCNGSSSTNRTILNAQAGIMVNYNNMLYVGDGSNQVFVFAQNNRTGRVLRSFSTWPTFLYYDNRTSLLYITVMESHLAYIWPTNKTIPPTGATYINCTMNGLYFPSGIVVDSVGNVYISSYYCNWVTKWTPNATTGTLIVGSSVGHAGNDSQSLFRPYNLALDEANSFLYVADRMNHRVQRFVLGGSNVGVTVAGGNGQGSAANQLNKPTDIYLSKSGNSIYIADSSNNRVQKWNLNATSGTTVAGSPNGTAGQSAYFMNSTYGIAVDYEENYLYVSDSNNNRVQSFTFF